MSRESIEEKIISLLESEGVGLKDEAKLEDLVVEYLTKADPTFPVEIARDIARTYSEKVLHLKELGIFTRPYVQHIFCRALPDLRWC